MIGRAWTRFVDWINDLSTRLWVRMSAAFAGVILIGVLMTTLIGLVAFTVNVREGDVAQGFSAPGGPVDTVQQFLLGSPNHDGVELVLAGLQAAYPRDAASSISITFSYVTADGVTMFDAHPDDTSPWPYVRFDDRFPMSVNDQMVGSLRILWLAAFPEETPEDLFLDWLRQDFGVVVLIGTLIGVLSGVVLSRSMTAPLRQLADAAHAVGQRDLGQRVQPAGGKEMVKVGAAFNDMARKLEQAETLRRNLVADVAHELRTPLTVLQGSLRAILDDVYDMNKTEIANLYDQTRLLNRLVNDLHDLAQAEADQLPLAVGPLDLVPIVRRLAATFEAVAEASGITLRLDLPPTSPIINGDATRLAQVVNNLVNNALNHTPRGGDVRVSMRREGQHVCLSVEDTGNGIAPEHLPHVFERFYRVDRARSRSSGGAGLGLAIVRAIVEAHHGSVSASSSGQPGQGAVFTVRLPLYEAAPLRGPQMGAAAG